MLHIGFAAAIRLWKGNERFSRLFAGAWLLEAIRAAVLLPEVHTIGGTYWNEWFGFAEVLSFFATALLISSGAALMGHQVSRRLILIYFLVSIPTVLVSRYFGPTILENWLQITRDEAQFWPVLLNLVVMFVPATMGRVLLAWWLYKTWKQTAVIGAFIAFVFAITYSLVAVAAPIQYLYSFNPTWMKYAWCFRVFGFSMGMLMLIISRAEQEVHESVERLRTALRQLETAQQQAIGQARLKALGQMAAGVVHDVNNSLTPLMAYSHLLQSRGDLEPEARELARLIQVGATDMSQTVKRLDHFYRKSGNREFLEPLDLADLVEQTVNITKPKWQDQARTDRKQIRVSTKIDSHPHVRGDPSLLRSVLTNLIFNACEAIENEGTIQLQVAGDENNGVVSVTDNGVGMTNEQLQRCLEPFYTSKAHGVGLGLSECHGIIRQHGGEIDVESVLSKQTTVRFSLPVDSETRLPKKDAQHQNVSLKEKRPRILCIDDDELIVQSTTLLLKSLPAEVCSASDGNAGLAILSQRSFDLVLCDQGLPGMDGVSVLRAIKSQWPELPVVMVSGWALPEIVEGPSPDGFIAKPFSPDALFATVRELVQ